MTVKNPTKWKGMKYPDSEMVGLVFRFARPSESGLNALDVGCGPGRHMQVLVDMGYNAVGFDIDPEMCQIARSNGFDAMESDAAQFVAPTPLALAVCWGFVMVVEDAPKIISSWQADTVVVDWRAEDSSAATWAGNERLDENRFRLKNPGHVLHGQDYYFHSLDQCEIPGYERVYCQRVCRTIAEDHNVWYQTVHKKRLA